MRRTILALIAFLIAAPAISSAQTVTVRPKESRELFANPGMGWQTFHRFADDDPNLAGLPSGSAYFRFYWSQVEPEEGKIDFAMFDEMLAHAHRAGQKFAFRIMCAGTNNDYMHVPAWLKEKGCPGWEYSRGEDNVKHWVPDMDSPMFKEAHYRLIRELGAHYDGHPDLDLLDIGTVGLWGEWHMSGTGVDMPSDATCMEIIDEWMQAFPNTPKVMLIGHKAGMIHATAAGCGWRADCLGDMGGFSSTWNHMENMYPQQVAETAPEAWMRGPVAWESCWHMQKWVDENWCIPCIFDYALDYHASYLNNKSAKIPDGKRPEIERLLMRMGYRLVLKQAEYPSTISTGSPLTVAMTWENIGVAPPYRDYYVALRLTADSGLKTILTTGTSYKYWQPGMFGVTVDPSIPRNLAPGKYTLSVALVDKKTAAPAVKLAIEGRDSTGWYPLGTITVK